MRKKGKGVGRVGGGVGIGKGTGKSMRTHLSKLPFSLGRKSCRTKVPGIFRIFVLDFAPNFAPNFPRIFCGSFVRRFVGKGDHQKLTRNPRRFSMQNSQANMKKQYSHCFLQSRQSDFSKLPFSLFPPWKVGLQIRPFLKGLWRVSEGFLKGSWRGFEGSFGSQVQGPFRDPFRNPSEVRGFCIRKRKSWPWIPKNLFGLFLTFYLARQK